jgi:hypothetical protein
LLVPETLVVSLLEALRMLSANDRADVILGALIFDFVLLWIAPFVILQMRAVARERRGTNSTSAAV